MILIEEIKKNFSSEIFLKISLFKKNFSIQIKVFQNFSFISLSERKKFSSKIFEKRKRQTIEHPRLIY